jgi:hypothetical protein
MVQGTWRRMREPNLKVSDSEDDIASSMEWGQRTEMRMQLALNIYADWQTALLPRCSGMDMHV